MTGTGRQLSLDLHRCSELAVSHVRIDRYDAKPIISLVGPAASWITPLAVTGWLLSLFAPAFAAQALKRRARGSIVLGVLTLYLVFVNVLGSFFFIGLLGD